MLCRHQVALLSTSSKGISELILRQIHSHAIAPGQTPSIFAIDSLIPAFLASSIRCYPEAKLNAGCKPRAHPEATEQALLQSGHFNIFWAAAEQSTPLQRTEDILAEQAGSRARGAREMGLLFSMAFLILPASA